MINIFIGEAIARLRRAGWCFTESDALEVVSRNGRRKRKVTYSDKIGSLVPKVEIDRLCAEGRVIHDV